MELINKTVPESIQYLGNEIVNIPAGDKLRIKCGDEDLLDVKVPRNKFWETHIHIEVIETNV